jgi:hypothetical protein
VWNGVKTFRENDETIQSWPGGVAEGLGRKLSAVFPDHTENLEPGSGSKPLELVVYVDDWQKYPASASFGTMDANIIAGLGLGTKLRFRSSGNTVRQ